MITPVFNKGVFIMTDEELFQFLKDNPNIKDKFKELAKVTLNNNLEFTRGDAAEEAVMDYGRELKVEMLKSWGEKEVSRLSKNVEAQIPGSKKHRQKKN
jgi:hypothetical protein